MKKFKLYLILFSSILLVFSSCKKDESTPGPTPYYEQSGLYISCEGNFGQANATVDYYNPTSHEHVSDVFKLKNNRQLGDVLQSMNIINDKLYLVVNNSGKIEQADPHSMLSDTSNRITGLTSPRYICKINPTKAYVSDLYSNHMSVINLTTNTISSTIALNGWTDNMLLFGNNVFVLNENSEYLYIIDATSDAISDSIHISKLANSLVLDPNGKLWVLCAGDYLGSWNGALYKIDPSTKNVELNLGFNQGEAPEKLCIDGNELYFLNTNVYKMNTSSATLPANSFMQSNGNSFYGLGINPSTHEVYVGDALGFTQRGKVYRYTASGSLIESFSVGIAPNGFLFF